MEKFNKYKVLIPWIFVLIFFFITIYLFLQLSHKDNLINKQEEITKVVQAVGKLMVLPEEVPSVATVTDLDKLKGQAFFANAKVGDKVLIYVKAQKAILYDPVMNKIVELAPLNFK